MRYKVCGHRCCDTRLDRSGGDNYRQFMWTIYTKPVGITSDLNFPNYFAVSYPVSLDASYYSVRCY